MNLKMILTRFLGALRHAAGVSEIAVDIEDNISIVEMLKEIARELPALKQSLNDQKPEELRSNALIIVNGREISVLDGLETKLKDGDELVLIPVVHGG
jgi:molybdopterin synthase sulfur carrier subunit